MWNSGAIEVPRVMTWLHQCIHCTGRFHGAINRSLDCYFGPVSGWLNIQRPFCQQPLVKTALASEYEYVSIHKNSWDAVICTCNCTQFERRFCFTTVKVMEWMGWAIIISESLQDYLCWMNHIARPWLASFPTPNYHPYLWSKYFEEEHVNYIGIAFFIFKSTFNAAIQSHAVWSSSPIAKPF